MFWNSITYEMSLDRKEYFRKVYGSLDFLRDIGGLFAGIATIFSPMVLLFQYRGSYYLLMNDNLEH